MNHSKGISALSVMLALTPFAWERAFSSAFWAEVFSGKQVGPITEYKSITTAPAYLIPFLIKLLLSMK